MRNLAVIITIVFSVLLIFVVWLAIIRSDKRSSLSDFFNQREVSIKDLQPSIAGYADSNLPALQEEVTGNNQVAVDTNNKETDSFYIIVGSFKESDAAQDKAEKLKSTLQGEFILLPPSKEGYFRISFGKYSTREEAESTINTVRQSIDRGAWIYSVKNN